MPSRTNLSSIWWPLEDHSSLVTEDLMDLGFAYDSNCCLCGDLSLSVLDSKEAAVVYGYKSGKPKDPIEPVVETKPQPPKMPGVLGSARPSRSRLLDSEQLTKNAERYYREYLAYD